MDKFMLTSEAAALLNVTPRQVRNYLDAGKLEGKQVTPRLWLVTKDSVEQLRKEKSKK